MSPFLSEVSVLMAEMQKIREETEMNLSVTYPEQRAEAAVNHYTTSIIFIFIFLFISADIKLPSVKCYRLKVALM